MLQKNLPLNREIYIDLAYAGTPPKNWGPELEAELPEPFQQG